MKKKPTAGSPVFEAFPSDRISKATKDVNVFSLFTVLQKFPSWSNFCKLCQQVSVNFTSEFRENFEAPT